MPQNLAPAKPEQMKFIKQLQTELKIEEILQVDEIEYDTVGYQTDGKGNIIHLNLYECGVKNKQLEKIKSLTKLTSLNLHSNQIQDISTLAKLTNLTKVNLHSNQIQDISTLAKLTNLSELSLHSNQIQDISALAGLTNLSELSLSFNQIQDISALAKLTNLTILNLRHNQIQDISALARLTNLTILAINSNQIQDISALARLTNLSELNLNSNQIQDISALARLTNLTKVNLRYNQIQDISALARLTNLTKVNLRYNQIQDISALARLTNLSELSLTHNQIRDIKTIDSLKNLSSLKKLNLSFNKIKGEDVEIENYIKQLLPSLEWGGYDTKVTPQRGNKVLKFSKVFKDVLGNEDLAFMTAGILDNMDPRLETMFGVFGEWGRGKTFFINQVIDQYLVATPESPKTYLNHRYIRLDYHAWKYQNTPANWAYLYQILLEGYLKDKSRLLFQTPKWLNWQKKSRWWLLPIPFGKKMAIIDLNLKRNKPDIWWTTRQFIKVLVLIWQILPVILLLFILFVIFNQLNGWDTFGVADRGWNYLVDLFEKIREQFLIVVIPAVIGVPWILNWSKDILNNRVKITSTAQDLIKKFGKAKTFEDKLGIQAEIDKEIEILLKLWIPVDEVEKEEKKAKLKEEQEDFEKKGKKEEAKQKAKEILEEDEKYKPYTKIMLFIDDLDRCNEAGLIELIDSLRIMLEQKEIQKRMQIAVAVDERILQLAIRHKYSKMKLDDNNFASGLNLTYQNLSLEYLDKLFLLGVKLGNLESHNRLGYQKALNIEDQKIVDKAKQKKAEEENESQEKEQKKNQIEKKNQRHLENEKKKDRSESSKKNFDREILSEYEIQALNELSQTITETRPNFSPRQQLVFYYRFHLLRNLLINGSGTDWYKSDSFENINFAVQSLWYKTLEKRNWLMVEKKDKDGNVLKNEKEKTTTEPTMKKPIIEDLKNNPYKQNQLAKYLEIVVPY